MIARDFRMCTRLDPIPRNELQLDCRSGKDPLANRGTVRSTIYGGATTVEQIRTYL